MNDLRAFYGKSDFLIIVNQYKSVRIPQRLKIHIFKHVPQPSLLMLGSKPMVKWTKLIKRSREKEWRKEGGREGGREGGKQKTWLWGFFNLVPTNESVVYTTCQGREKLKMSEKLTKWPCASCPAVMSSLRQEEPAGGNLSVEGNLL